MERWIELIADTQTRYNLLCMRMRARATYVVGEESLLRPLDSATQLHAFERQLGFSLPPMLCHLYLTVSNGAEFFEPGNWIYGVPDEWHAQNPNAPTISPYQGFRKRVDPLTEHALETHPGAFVVLKDFPPEGTVSIADLGGGERIWLDGLTGKLWADSEFYDENHEFGGIAYSFWAPSVEDWLERKLAAPPNQESAGLYHESYPLAQIMRADGEISKADIPPAVLLDDLAHEAYARLRLGKQRGESMEQHMLHLRRMREQIVQNLYEVGNTWYAMVKEVGAVRARELGNEEVLQQLSNAEAQVYCIEWMIQTGGVLY